MINNSNDTPLVTIVTLSYNTRNFVVKALDCVKNQTYPFIELIIIDDASSDDSVALIEDWINRNNYKCTFIKRTNNLGAGVGANEALEMAKGKYFCGFSDDLCTNDRIEKQVKLFNNNNNVAFVCGNCNLIDEDDNYTGTYFPLDYVPPDNLFLSLLSLDRGPVICTPSALFNLEILRQVGGFYTKYLQGDYYLFLRLTKKYKVVYDKEILVSYRIRKDSYYSDPKLSAIMRRDMLYLLMSIEHNDAEEKIALNKGLLSTLKSAYYLVNTLRIDSNQKKDLYKSMLTAIKFLKDRKPDLTFSEKMFFSSIKNKIPYKYMFKAMKIIDNKFQM